MCLQSLQVTAEHSLQLQPMERVVTVAWQNTQQGPPLEPYQAAAAILTTQVCAWWWAEVQACWWAEVRACRNSVGAGGCEHVGGWIEICEGCGCVGALTVSKLH